MEKYNSRVLGFFVIWKDYVRFSLRSDGEQTFKQSNTKMEGYIDRHIGLSVVDSKVLISVAVSNASNKKENSRTAKNVIEQRMINIINKDYNIDPGDRGVTYLPKELIDMLWKDPYTYNNLFGSVDPTYIGMAIKSVT